MHGSVNLPRSHGSVMGLCFNHPYVLQPCLRLMGLGLRHRWKESTLSLYAAGNRMGQNFFVRLNACSSSGYYRPKNACMFFFYISLNSLLVMFQRENTHYKTWMEVERVYTNFTSEKHKENMEQKSWTSNGWQLTMLPGKEHLQITMLLGSRSMWSMFFQRCVVFTNNMYIIYN